MHTAANGERTHRALGFMAALGVVAGLLVATPAQGQSAEPESEGEKTDEDAKKDDAKQDGDLREDPLRRYYFLGVRFRDIVVPQFLLEIFAAGGSTGNVWLIGPELSLRKDSIEIDISLAYADYAFGPAIFRSKNDGPIANEMVESDLKVGYLTFDLLYDIPIDKSGTFSFLIGGGVGIGIVAGDLRRTQAYPKAGGDPSSTNPKDWQTCQFAGDGDPLYCDDTNDHFPQNGKDYSEKSWAEGGSKPIVFPWLSLPQLSFRVKPIKQLQARVDVGFSVTGFFTGLSAGYGF